MDITLARKIVGGHPLLHSINAMLQRDGSRHFRLQVGPNLYYLSRGKTNAVRTKI
jgi:hypothetical protein